MQKQTKNFFFRAAVIKKRIISLLKLTYFPIRTSILLLQKLLNFILVFDDSIELIKKNEEKILLLILLIWMTHN